MANNLLDLEKLKNEENIFGNLQENLDKLLSLSSMTEEELARKIEIKHGSAWTSVKCKTRLQLIACEINHIFSGRIREKPPEIKSTWHICFPSSSHSVGVSFSIGGTDRESAIDAVKSRLLNGERVLGIVRTDYKMNQENGLWDLLEMKFEQINIGK